MAEMEKKPTKTRRREKKNVPVGQVHIAASFNNTVISITDPTGAVLSWGSGGVAGLKYSSRVQVRVASRRFVACRPLGSTSLQSPM
jgi:small subunit ribosomal protein S11